MLKTAALVYTVQKRHLLEGGGCQTVNTRSTFGEALKYFGYNGTNELCGRSMTSKLTYTSPMDYFTAKDLDQKVYFFGQISVTENFHWDVFWGNPMKSLQT